MLFHVILIFGISATSQSATGYTAMYTGVESFVVTALMRNEDESKVIVNLASNEYFKGIDKKALNANIINW
jgi:cytoplasmic iron level regulating protein YaaA (DUF328/UPF0246 family)